MPRATVTAADSESVAKEKRVRPQRPHSAPCLIRSWQPAAYGRQGALSHSEAPPQSPTTDVAGTATAALCRQPPSSEGTCGSSHTSSLSEESMSPIGEAHSPVPGARNPPPQGPMCTLVPPKLKLPGRKAFVAPKLGWWEEAPEGFAQGSSGLFPEVHGTDRQQPCPGFLHSQQQPATGPMCCLREEDCSETARVQRKHVEPSLGQCNAPGFRAGRSNGGPCIHRACAPGTSQVVGACMHCVLEGLEAMNRVEQEVQTKRQEEDARPGVDKCVVTRFKEVLGRFLGCIMPQR